MDNELYKQIIGEHKELSSLPQTLSEVLRVISDEDASASDLAEVLIKDPGLTTKVLRVVNSPIYTSGKNVSSMNLAVMTLGQRSISALALSTSIYDVAGSLNSSIDKKKFWRHSLEVAIAAREIAEAIRYECIEEAFITGLVHDIGLLVMESSFPEKFDRIWKKYEAGEDILGLEEGIWGTNHARLGRFLLEQWNIPQVICDAVGHYYSEFAEGETNPDFKLSQILALATMMSKFTLSSAVTKSSEDVGKKYLVATNLGLNEERLREIQDSILAKTIEEANFLEIEIGSTNDLLVEANRMLYGHYQAVESLLEERVTRSEIEKKEDKNQAAIKVLNTITATFNHYINNANASIMGRAQLLNLSLEKGNISDDSDTMDKSLKVIINGVNTISAVMDELKKLSSFDTVIYHDDTYIINIEEKLKEHLASMEKAQQASNA